MQILQLLLVIFIYISSVFSANIYRLDENIKVNNKNVYNDPHFVENRTTIVHLFEWKWNDIATECEKFLGPEGFGGVQVSPVNENIIINSPNRPWWERYQPVSYQLYSRSGNARDFIDMVHRCNRVGVRIYVDVVFNHMTGNNSENLGTAGSYADYENFNYPSVPYERVDFNEPCIITDFSDPVMLRNCELYGLRDLNQTSNFVRVEIINFLNGLIEMGIAGFRIDAAMHMWPDDLKYIYGRLHDLNTEQGFEENSRPFIYQEVIDLGLDTIDRNEYLPLGAITEYRAGIHLGLIFRGLSPFEHLEYWGENLGLTTSDHSIVFMENQDNQRGNGMGGDIVLTYKNFMIYKASIAFLLAHDYGYVRLMSSYAFNDPNAGPPVDDEGNILSPYDESGENCRNEWICEHRWGPIYRMVQFRNRVKGISAVKFLSDKDYFILERRGKGIFIVLTRLQNRGFDIGTRMPPGIYCDIISGEKISNICTGKNVTIRDNGTGFFNFNPDDEEIALAIHVGSESMLS